ncbi:MAG: hypothetical protein HY678_11700 [Chloroflexi bacterium]|nr:hypothetical protein [Chloroflexota bacterium]
MRLRAIGIACAAATIAAAVFIALVQPASAHGGRVIGDCDDASAASTASPAVDPEVPGRRDNRLPRSAFRVIAAVVGLVVAAGVVLTSCVRKRAAWAAMHRLTLYGPR